MRLRTFICETHNCRITNKTCIARLEKAYKSHFTTGFKPDLSDKGAKCWRCERGLKLAKRYKIENKYFGTNKKKKKKAKDS